MRSSSQFIVNYIYKCNSTSREEKQLIIDNKVMFTNAILQACRGSNSNFYTQLGEATLNLLQSILTNAICKQVGEATRNSSYR